MVGRVAYYPSFVTGLCHPSRHCEPRVFYEVKQSRMHSGLRASAKSAEARNDRM
jgi:hypothetical protein